MIGIYKITNPAGKIYIGASKNIQKRIKQHTAWKRNIPNGSLLDNSFFNYGVKNHLFEIIEECELDILNERERYWQEYYSTTIMGLNYNLVGCRNKKGVIGKEVIKKILHTRDRTKDYLTSKVYK